MLCVFFELVATSETPGYSYDLQLIIRYFGEIGRYFLGCWSLLPPP